MTSIEKKDIGYILLFKICLYFVYLSVCVDHIVPVTTEAKKSMMLDALELELQMAVLQMPGVRVATYRSYRSLNC